MKFNMGCGSRHLPGFVNVDASDLANPDVVFNLETTPWPWPDGCATEVRFIHSLEHMGQSPEVFLRMISELYRICADNCEVVIHVPHPRHDNFISDPTHVRPITHATLALFDKALCERNMAARAANTPLALMIGVDFQVANVETVLDEPYFSDLQAGRLSTDAAVELVKTGFNIARELRFTMLARKAVAAESQ